MPHHVATAEAEPPLILVVEDYDDARRMYGAYLAHCGFRVVLAADGEEAVEKATTLLPDLVLMDLSLPKLDGWEATRQLKANRRTQHIPVVALTAYALPRHIEAARQAGCSEVIAKPCVLDELVEHVINIVSPDGNADRNTSRVNGSARKASVPHALRHVS
jgi:two-component system, cell cycle response regulator DivK